MLQSPTMKTEGDYESVSFRSVRTLHLKHYKPEFDESWVRAESCHRDAAFVKYTLIGIRGSRSNQQKFQTLKQAHLVSRLSYHFFIVHINTTNITSSVCV